MKIKFIKQKIFATLALILTACIGYFFHLPCIFLRLTGIRCLGCGMTRAIIAAISLDFSSAFSFHFMFWSVPILYIALLTDGRIFPNKRANIILYVLIGIGFVANWLCHLI